MTIKDKAKKVVVDEVIVKTDSTVDHAAERIVHTFARRLRGGIVTWLSSTLFL